MIGLATKMYFLHGSQSPSYKYKSNLESWYIGQLIPINALSVRFKVGKCWSLPFLILFYSIMKLNFKHIYTPGYENPQKVVNGLRYSADR